GGVAAPRGRGDGLDHARGGGAHARRRRGVEAMTSGRRPGLVRRERSLTEPLLSITLALEAAMMFFASLVVFGLDRLDPDWLALVYGAVFIIVLVIAAALQRYTWGVWFGAVLQLAIIATGLLE